MQRSLVPVLTLVLLAAAIPAGAGSAAADGFVSVSTAVEPSQPVPEEEFTIQTTISSSPDSSTDYRLVEAEVRRGPGPNAELVSEEGFRTGFGPGTSKTVGVEATLNESGTHEVFLRLTFRDGTGDKRILEQRMEIQVIEGHPQAEVSTDAALPGDDQTLTVGVSNGLDAAVNNVEVLVDSDTVEIRNPRRVVATVGAGSAKSLEFRATPDAETVQPVDVTVRYTYEGDRREVSYELSPDFTPTSDVEHPQTEVSTDASLPGDAQELSVDVSNGLDTTLRNVEVVVESDTVAIQSARRVTAAVDSGATRSFDFEATPDAETVQPVNVTLRYTADGERREVRRTLRPDFTPTTDVEHPQVSVDAESGEPGEPRTVAVTLSNGLDQTVRNLELQVAGDRIDVSDARRVSAAVSAGATEVFEFTVSPESAAKLPVEVEVAYTVGGERRGVGYTLQTDFRAAAEPVDHPQLQLDVEEAVTGATRSVNVTVANGLERNVRQVGVVVSSPAVEFKSTERVMSTLQAGQTTQLRFPAVADEAGTYPVNVTLVYRDDGVLQRITRTFQADFSAPSNPGRITLTGVDAVARGGTVELSATASNLGSESVDSVVVTIPDSESVTGTDYFVGGVDPSDFASFTVSTTAGENVSTLPVEVTYIVDGVEKTFTTEVPVERDTIQQASRSTSGGSGGGGVPLIPVAAVGVLVIVLAVAYRVRG